MTDLSPAAQAVMIAATNGNFNVVDDPVYKQCIAAALVAAVDQVIPLTPKPNDTFCIPPVATMVWMRGTDIRKKLLAIAAELEAQ